MKFLTIQRDVTSPILARKKIKVGISKTSPMPRRTFRVTPKNVSTVIMGEKSAPRLRKNLQAKGNAT